jgi:Holliday junction resolvase RusA-like endonuclease
MKNDNSIHIWLPFKAKPKARGRATIVDEDKGLSSYMGIKFRKRKPKIKVYTDPGYRRWKNEAIAYLVKLKLEGFLPELPKPCYIECLFCNFAKGDEDNLQGAIADALVQAKLLPDDCSAIVVGGSGKFVKVHKKRNEPRRIGVAIKISPAKIDWVDVEPYLKYERYLETRNVKAS